MSKASFIIRLADLDRGLREFDWELPVEWLTPALSDTEALPTGPGRVTMTASKNGTQVVLHGRARAKVTMPCARTLSPVEINLDSEIVLLLRPAPTTKGPHAQSSRTHVHASKEPRRAARESGSMFHKSAMEPDNELTAEDASEDVYHGEQIELDGFIREFLILELPMMPLRSGLRDEGRPAIPATPESTADDDVSHVDPRLRPLAELASRLKKSTKE